MRGHRLDIFWAYGVSLSRVASWVVVYGALYRLVGAEAAALLALVRWTLGLLNYASAGLSPAILHHAAKNGRGEGAGEETTREGTSGEETAGEETAGEGTARAQNSLAGFSPSRVLNYSADAVPAVSLRATFTTGIVLSWIGAVIGGIALWTWVLTQGEARGVAALVGLFGSGMLIDVAADAWGAVIQSRGRIRTDYQFQALLETIWALLAGVGIYYRARLGISWQMIVGGSYLIAAIVSALPRAGMASRLIGAIDDSSSPRWNAMIARLLLGFGGLIVLSQIAEFLYAPTDFLLIRWLIDLPTIAVYAPAVQMDVGIWLLISGFSTALLPMSARQFGRGNFAKLRRYYLQGTGVSLLLLLIASLLAWVAAPAIFKLWLGNKMAGTQRILPLVLVSTVVGGSAAVGRSILLATGHVRAFTASVLIAGVLNVLFSYFFVVYYHMGLVGIILGTIIVVVGRCAIWMPIFVLRVLRKDAEHASLK